MPRKPRKGYFVQGRFVAAGSAQDLLFKAERKGRPEASRSERKRESQALQTLGEQLLALRAERFDALRLPDELLEALAEARRISDFEGRRRQMQFVGKIMRRLDPALAQAARQALAEQHQGSASDNLRLHQAERWRQRLIADDQALALWLAEHPGSGSDTQALRALIRQARKDAAPGEQAQDAQRQAARKGRAYRELFQLVHAQLDGASAQPSNNDEENAHG